jgi:RHS repeat-associated protein
MRATKDCDINSNAWLNGFTYNGRYHNKFAYDANGNITYQLRKDENGTAINKLTYKRQVDANNDLMRNRLYHIRDSVSSGAFADDIDDQGYFSNHTDSVNISNNYSYDAIGNLTKNTQKEIDTILYSVYGKVKEVIRTSGSSKKNLKFDYDANGNRTAKHVFDSYNNWEKSEYYVLDAQGNVMSIYENKVDTVMHYTQTEKHIFGSNRLGAEKTPLEMIGAVAIADGTPIEHALGYKHFDASNHLGNTLITFTDRKIPVDLNIDNLIDEYWPDVIASNDYYPFGVKMKERSFSSENTRYQFNGKQFDEETETTDFGARNQDGDLGIWNALDPLAKEYPGTSPYAFATNNPVYFVDKNGESPWSWIQRTAQKFMNLFKGNGFKMDSEVKQIKDEMAIKNEHTYLIKLELYRAQSFAMNGIEYTPKSELDLYVQARHNVLGEGASYGGTIKNWTPDVYQEIERYIDAPTSGYADALAKATTGVLYETVNSPYSFVTDESLGGDWLSTPKERMDVMVDLIPLKKLMAPLKVVDVIVETKKGLKGLQKFNDFAKKTKGNYTGEGHQAQRGFGFRKNETNVKALEQGSDAVENANNGSNIIENTKENSDEKK